MKMKRQKYFAVKLFLLKVVEMLAEDAKEGLVQASEKKAAGVGRLPKRRKGWRTTGGREKGRGNGVAGEKGGASE